MKSPTVEAHVRGCSEQQLLQALRERRKEAYLEVIETHYRSVYRLLLFLSHNSSLAEDMTQEVFASAWGAIDTFRGDASVKTWLRRIAYNVFLDVQRRRGRDKVAGDVLPEPDSVGVRDPLSEVMADEDRAAVCRALDDLAFDERTVLLLHYMDGLSYREMSEVLDQPDGTLKWITGRALKKLRERLAGKAEL
jgi:RNA polymerase sigma-70 factor (ECF subfamily)